MCELYDILKQQNTYYDRLNYTLEQYNAALQASSTVYVGNLSYHTTQDSIRELFTLAGKVVQIIMGINKEGHACGFCFVIYETHEQAGYAVQYISKTRLNDRIIRVDWDPGYKKGREVGRGTGGQQRREDFRTKDDAQRPRKRPAYEGRDKQRDYRGDRDRYERGRGDRQDDYRGERFQRSRANRDYGDRGDRGERDRGDRGDRNNRGDREDRVDRGGDRRDRQNRGGDRDNRYRRQYEEREYRNQRFERQDRPSNSNYQKQAERMEQQHQY